MSEPAFHPRVAANELRTKLRAVYWHLIVGTAVLAACIWFGFAFNEDWWIWIAPALLAVSLLYGLREMRRTQRLIKLLDDISK